MSDLPSVVDKETSFGGKLLYPALPGNKTPLQDLIEAKKLNGR
jgi:hypothetical protein